MTNSTKQCTCMRKNKNCTICDGKGYVDEEIALPSVSETNLGQFKTVATQKGKKQCTHCHKLFLVDKISQHEIVCKDIKAREERDSIRIQQQSKKFGGDVFGAFEEASKDLQEGSNAPLTEKEVLKKLNISNRDFGRNIINDAINRIRNQSKR